MEMILALRMFTPKRTIQWEIMRYVNRMQLQEFCSFLLYADDILSRSITKHSDNHANTVILIEFYAQHNIFALLETS